MTTDPGLCPATTPTRHSNTEFACTQPAGHPGDHIATGVGGHPLHTWTNPDPPVTLEHGTAVLEGHAPGHVLWADRDMETFAALPDCQHCGGTGKNLTGSPWDNTPGGDKP